jgi:hypothetical protein
MAAVQADELLVQDVADAAERFHAEVLLAVLDAVDGRLAGVQSAGEFCLRQCLVLALFERLINQFCRLLYPYTAIYTIFDILSTRENFSC